MRTRGHAVNGLRFVIGFHTYNLRSTRPILDDTDPYHRTLALEPRINRDMFDLPWEGTDEAGKLVSDGTYVGLVQAVPVGHAA